MSFEEEYSRFKKKYSDTSDAFEEQYKIFKKKYSNLSDTSKEDVKKSSIMDNVGYVLKNVGVGALGGLTGIEKATSTEIQNNLEKGEKEKRSLLTFAKAMNPILGLVSDNIENTKQIFSDKESSFNEKAVKSINNGITSVLNNITPGKNLLDEAIKSAGAANPNAKNIVKNFDEKISEPYNNLQNEINKESEKYGNITKTIGNVANVVGNMVPSIVATGITKNPTIGLTTMGISAKGQSTQEALDKGANLDEAVKIGNTKGMIEVGTEKLTGGAKIFGKGSLDDIVENGIKNQVESKVGKFLVKQGYDYSGEVVEETISDVLGNFIDKGTVDPDAKYSINDFGDTAVTTILSTAVLKALGVPMNKLNKMNTSEETKTENEQKVYDSEINSRTSKKIKENTIENEYNKQIQTQENLGIELTSEMKDKIREKVERAYESGTLNNTELSEKERKQIENEVENDMNDGNISVENIMNTLGENQDLSKDKLLMKSMYENEQKYNSYQYEKTDNEKVNALLQSATEAGLNNTTKTKRKVELISKLVQDTNRQYRFVSREQLKQMGYNENANGLIDKSTGEILINAQTNKGVQSIIGHETTHIFDSENEKGEYSKEYQTLQNAAIEYAKTKGIYNEKVQDITESYGDLLVNESQIKEELTADLVGDFLFNDEKFIEHLATKDRNIFQKIYDYVKHAYKMITAKTDDAKALEKMKYQFDKVYKTISENNNTDIKYHISKNFSNEIEQSLDGKITSNNQIKARDYTPQILVENGVKDLPMLLTQKHLRQIVYTKEQAQKLGYNVSSKDHYHGLGKDTLIKAIDNMDSPQEIYQQTDTNYLIITEIKDENNNQIIVPVRIDGTGTYNNIDILENQISSVYGRKNLEKYIKDNNFKKIYKKNRSNNNNEGVKSHDTIDTSITSITSKDEDVNTNSKYSMQDNRIYTTMTNNKKITGDDIAVKDMLKQERLQRQSENTLNEEVEQNNVSEDKAETNLKTKARNYISRSKTRLKNDIVLKFGTSKYANTQLLNDTVSKIENDIQNGELNEEKTEKYFNELYDNLKKIDTEYYDEYKELKKEIQNTKLYIPDSVRNNIADYNEFRQKNMGNIIMTNNPENVSIASKYAELSEIYPDLFPELSNEAEMLEKIADVNKDIKKVETNVSAYNDQYLGKEYRMWAKEEFKASLGDFRRDINNAMRYNAETTLKEKQIITKEQAKELYKAIPEAKKKYEKALAKEVLTKTDKIQVDRLLNGEINIEELPKDSNKEGIIRLATAKSEYNAIQKTIDKYVKEIKETRLEEAEKDVGDLSLWKDKKSGWRYNRETPIRNIYDIAPKDVAERVVNKYFRSYIEVNEKKVVDNINKYNDRVRLLKIDTNKKYKLDINGQKIKATESGLIQLLGEKKISIENIKEAGANADKIEKCVNEFRNIYNELIDGINNSMIENGYAPMEYRKDYFPHFTEEEPDTLLGKAAKLFRIDITNEELPTDISGKTMYFKPGRTWFGNMLRRTTDITDYDVLKGFDKYIRGASDLIYHTNDIQNLRALSTVTRGAYNDTEVQNKIAEIEESTDLDIFEKAERITEIKKVAKDKSHLSKFVEWLDNYTNLLAGKKAFSDRDYEQKLNRKMYKTMQSVESKFAANAIGLNVGVAISNIGPVAQALGEMRPDYILGGFYNTAKYAIIEDKSFVSNSSFITRRRGSDYLSQTTTDKVVSALTKPLNLVDNFVSESLVRAKYRENLDKGMSEQVALEKADQYVAGLMADRGRGALPTQFNNKNPVAKMVNMFQVEVNNQWSYYFKDLPRNLQKDGKKSLAFAFTKIMVGSYLMNNAIESIRGSRVLFDPIYIVQELIRGLSDDDPDNDADAIWNALTNILGNIPGASLPATVLGIDDVGRVPITGMVPDLKDMIGNVTDVVNNEKTLKQGATDIGKELLNTIGASLILPVGGAQIKKSIKGISQYSSDKPVAGSYNENGDLKYTVNTDIGSKIKSFVFGASANPYAQDYVDSGYKTIKADNIDEMVGLDMNSTEYRNYKKELNKAGNVSDKNGYKQYTDNSGNIYWYDKDNDIVYNSDYQKTVINKDDLTKVAKKEEQLKYINSLDIDDDKKQIMTNNLTKDSKKYIDIKEYGNYDSYEEYTYARDNPNKYSTINQICSYDEFKTYQKDINNIAKEYKERSEAATTSKEKSAISKQKKKEIQKYINELPLEIEQKMMLEKEAGGYSIKNYKQTIYNYLENAGLDNAEKYNIWKELFD